MKAIALVALLAAAPSIAHAADEARWNGAYIGASAGYASSDVQHTDVNANFEYAGMVYQTGGNSASGFLNAGIDWQSGSFLLGAEADIGTLSADGEAFPSGPEDAASFYMTSKVNNLASIRARAGIAMDHALIYVTGGIAFANMETKAYYEGEAPNAHDGWRNGWVAGGGLEYSINDNWTIRTEGLYYDLGTTQAYWPGFGTDYLEKVSASVLVGRAGLNYRF